jgi:uncharacterized protein YsxB (DUF464 family)
MIHAIIYKNVYGVIQGFKISGHAYYDEPGRDIVCSAVSAIVFTALGGMDELAGFRRFKEEDGLITCFIPDNLTAEQLEVTDIILKTMVVGLRQIETDYGKYIRISYEEV